MKKSIPQIILICVLFVLGCTPQKNNDRQTTQTNQTPEVFTESKNRLSFDSFKSYRSSIIEELYNEALSKNEKLKAIDDKISEITSDSIELKTKAYLKFRSTNLDYFGNAETYISTITDSVLRKSAIALLKNFRDGYDKKVSQHETKMNSIGSLKSKLSDQHSFLKLIVTQNMMNNYQSNEMPKVEELESMIKDLELVLNDARAYIKAKK